MLLDRYENFISCSEADEILDWLETKPYTKETTTLDPSGAEVLQYRNKNIDLHLPESRVRQIIYPKLEKLFHNPCPTHSAFLESHYPFSLHVDTVQTFQNENFYSTNSMSNNRAVLIALNESPDFQTVFFDFFSDDLKSCFQNLPEIDESLPVPIYPGVNDLSHFAARDRSLLQHHNIQYADHQTWKKGQAISWPRTQLHCSGNFYRKGFKQALIMFF